MWVGASVYAQNERGPGGVIGNPALALELQQCIHVLHKEGQLSGSSGQPMLVSIGIQSKS